MKEYRKANWKTSVGDDVVNRDLWERLDNWRRPYHEAAITYELKIAEGQARMSGIEAAKRLVQDAAANTL